MSVDQFLEMYFMNLASTQTSVNGPIAWRDGVIPERRAGPGAAGRRHGWRRGDRSSCSGQTCGGKRRPGPSRPAPWWTEEEMLQGFKTIKHSTGLIDAPDVSHIHIFPGNKRDFKTATSFAAFYLRIENTEGYVLIAVYLFIYLYAYYSHNSRSIKSNRMKFGGMIGY